MVGNQTSEAEAIPYEPATLRGERLLVLAPHPDDEVIGCGGLLAQHIQEGRAVRIVVASDGAAAGEATEREAETRRGLEVIGGDADLHFLRLPDRHLDARHEVLSRSLREHLVDFKPDLILVPSPVEIHPDHIALSRTFCSLIASDDMLFAELALARVAFYEVSQPLRPNTLVDITDVAGAKYEAIAEHSSQLAQRDYVGFTRGLNAYRAMTIAPRSRFAEAYWVDAIARLRTLPFSALEQRMGQKAGAEITREQVPVSIVIRTKNRPALLREALDSVQSTGYDAEIVVVNDGGEPLGDLSDVPPPKAGATYVEARGAGFSRRGIRVIQHESSRGRSEAMNSAVNAASAPFIAFLDDDDLFYPEHLQTLSNAASSSQHRAWYTDAVSAFVRVGSSGAPETHSRLRLFSQDFDRELLLLDNYIPLPTLLVRRDSFLELGGFDPAIDLFEDWDFLIRLAQEGDFLHVPRVTCEVRHFEGGDSITLASPEGSPRFREARLQIWRKHAALIDNNVIASVLERQKKRMNTLYSSVVEEKGRGHHLDLDIARGEREKKDLVTQIQTLHNSVTQALMRIRELEGMHEATAAERQREREEAAALRAHNAELNHAIGDLQQTVKSLYGEINRLQGLLDIIYRSKTWKLHEIVEKLRGRQ